VGGIWICAGNVAFFYAFVPINELVVIAHCAFESVIALGAAWRALKAHPVHALEPISALGQASVVAVEELAFRASNASSINAIIAPLDITLFYASSSVITS